MKSKASWVLGVGGGALLCASYGCGTDTPDKGGDSAIGGTNSGGRAGGSSAGGRANGGSSSGGGPSGSGGAVTPSGGRDNVVGGAAGAAGAPTEDGGSAGAPSMGGDGSGGDGSGGGGGCRLGECGPEAYLWPSADSLETIANADLRFLFGTDDDVWAFGGAMGPSAPSSGSGAAGCGQPGTTSAPQLVRIHGGQRSLMTVPFPYELMTAHYHNGHIWATGNSSVMVHFDGQVWADQTALVRNAVPASADPCKSYGVRSGASGPNNVWTTWRMDAGTQGSWVTHFNGTELTLKGQLIVGDPPSAEKALPTAPDDIFPLSSTDVWFGSLYGVGHFDGDEWSLIEPSSFKSVSLLLGLGANNVWAYGGDPWGRTSVKDAFADHFAGLTPADRQRFPVNGDVVTLKEGPDSAVYGLLALKPSGTQVIAKLVDEEWVTVVAQASGDASLRDFLVTPNGSIWGMGGDFVAKL